MGGMTVGAVEGRGMLCEVALNGSDDDTVSQAPSGPLRGLLAWSPV